MGKIDKAAEAKLWGEYMANPGIPERNALVVFYQPMVEAFAGKYWKKNRHLTMDELISDGQIGLLDAIRNFDPLRGFAFITYGGKRIFHAMRDAVRERDEIPRLSRRRATMIREVNARVFAEKGRGATNEELQEELGMDDREFANLRADKAGFIAFTSADRKLFDFDDSGSQCCPRGVSVKDDLADNSPPPYAREQREDFWKQATRSLNRTEKAVITLYYRDGMNMKKTGAAIGITEGRVCQIHNAVIAQLRARPELLEAA